MFCALILVALAGYASAANLSVGCKTALAAVSRNPDASVCLAPSALIHALSGSSNDTLLNTIDGWVTNMCAAQPCSTATLSAVVKNITTGCASDASVSSAFLENIHSAQFVYPTVRKILCLQDSGKNCVTSTLANVQAFMGSGSKTIANLSDSNFGALIATAGSFVGKLKSNANVTPTPHRRSTRFGRRANNDTQTTTSTDSTSKLPANMTCTACIRTAAQIIQTDFPGTVDSMFPGLAAMCSINSTNTTAANATKAATTTKYKSSTTGMGALLSDGGHSGVLLAALATFVAVSLG